MNAFISYYKAHLKEMFAYPLGFLVSLIIDPLMVLVTISLFKSIVTVQPLAE